MDAGEQLRGAFRVPGVGLLELTRGDCRFAVVFPEGMRQHDLGHYPVLVRRDRW
jgi:hypothetical protein